jgi:hypothetical protein
VEVLVSALTARRATTSADGNGATGYDDDDGDGATGDDGDGATGDNVNDVDGDLGLGARLLPPSSLPTPRPVGG